MRKLLCLLFFICGAALAQQPPIVEGGVTYNYCADEGGQCNFSGTKDVLFGIASAHAKKTFTSHADCYVSGGGFDSDPAEGADKFCWVAAGTAPPPPPTVSLTANPTSIVPGGLSVLTLATTGATSCTGPVAGTNGTASVSPPSTQTYTESCTGAGGNGVGTATITVTPVQTGGLTCQAPTSVAGSGPSGVISADVVSANGTRVFPLATNFTVKFDTNAPAQNLNWTIKNAKGAIVLSGSTATAAGARTTSMICNSSTAGYFALGATLASSGGQVASRGTRPAGFASFGVTPSLGATIGVQSPTPDQRRFGFQGFNSNFDALQVLGATDVLDDYPQSLKDHNCTGSYAPSASHLPAFFVSHPSISYIARLDGLPPCNSPVGADPDIYHSPVNPTNWANFLHGIGQENELVRSNFPGKAKNYYEVLWEPSNSGEWLNGASPSTMRAHFLNAFNSLHAFDPHAVIMGPTEPFPDNNGNATGNRLQFAGMCDGLDGITTHAYWDAPATVTNAPEKYDQIAGAEANSLSNSMKNLRIKMQVCKPNMILFNTESGAPYDGGTSYMSVTQNQLWAHGAVAARQHIIVLGEGAQRTYGFYGIDFPHEFDGYGFFFDLVQNPPQFGDTTISPKPAGMAFAALSRVLDGTKTLGRVTGTASGIYAYSFRQLTGTKVITAAWVHSNAQWNGPNSFSQTYTQSLTLDVDVAGTSGTVAVIDMMGNVTSASYTNGKLTRALTEEPVYIVSNNPTVAAAHVTAPVGYTGQ